MINHFLESGVRIDDCGSGVRINRIQFYLEHYKALDWRMK